MFSCQTRLAVPQSKAGASGSSRSAHLKRHHGEGHAALEHHFRRLGVGLYVELNHRPYRAGWQVRCRSRPLKLGSMESNRGVAGGQAAPQPGQNTHHSTRAPYAGTCVAHAEAGCFTEAGHPALAPVLPTPRQPPMITTSTIPRASGYSMSSSAALLSAAVATRCTRWPLRGRKGAGAGTWVGGSHGSASTGRGEVGWQGCPKQRANSSAACAKAGPVCTPRSRRPEVCRDALKHDVGRLPRHRLLRGGRQHGPAQGPVQPAVSVDFRAQQRLQWAGSGAGRGLRWCAVLQEVPGLMRVCGTVEGTSARWPADSWPACRLTAGRMSGLCSPITTSAGDG